MPVSLLSVAGMMCMSTQTDTRVYISVGIILSTHNLKKHDFFRNNACTSMTDFLFQVPYVRSFSLSLSLSVSRLVTVWMWQQTMASFDPFPIHASAFHSSAICKMPQIFCQSSCPTLVHFNDGVFPIGTDFRAGDEDSNFSVFRVRRFSEWPEPLH